MILVRTTMIVAVAALVLAVALPIPADNGDDELLKTEWLTYAGANLLIPTILLGDVYVASTPCDEAGVGGVAFCQTLRPWESEDENETYPDRVYINVRDDLGPRVGFYYEFINGTSGNVLWNGFECGAVNTLVPHTGQGTEEGDVFDENATELRIIPDLLESAAGESSVTSVPSLGIPENITQQLPQDVQNETPEATPGIDLGHPFPCGSPTITTGTATVVWRYNATVFDTSDL